MWRELIRELAPDAGLGAPAERGALRAAEEALGRPLPSALSELLGECDGIVGPDGLDVVWELDRIRRDNLAFRTEPAFAELYMPFEPLVFFGDNGGGDQFAFVRTPPRDDVFVWDHETDGRGWAANGLRDYLRRALTEAGDWYR
ncbi:SMI1/KNR4 family protein [Streptomyces sp. NPDC018833]|uniref:SMI1/KNR4 family protein n=1 Tax=Streptomyces sp. NPDC018833 TaxID=3365053 RepID=UPI0037BB3D50